MAGQDATQILVLAAGDVYVGPTTSDAPTDAETALDTDFIKLGYIDNAGPSLTPGRTTVFLTGWQGGGFPLRILTTARSLTIVFNLLQMTEEALVLAMGGGSWSGGTGDRTYDPPAPQDLDQRSLVIEGMDGDKTVRWYVPVASVTDVGAMSFTNDGAASVPITMQAVVTSPTQKISQVFHNIDDQTAS